MYKCNILYLLIISISVWLPNTYAGEPVPDIRINGSDGPYAFAGESGARITVSLNPGEHEDQMADWRLYAETSYGTFYYDLENSWQPGLELTYQGKLFALPPFEVLNSPLPPGTYQMHFAVETQSNGDMDEGKIYRDSVRIQSTIEAEVITGRVISLAGQPISGALVSSLAGEAISNAISNAEGWFEIPALSSVQWVTVRHSDYLSRTRATKQGEPVLFRLTPDDGETVAIHFGGDSMFGRRYYDPNEDGNTEDGLLPLGAGAEKHLALLKWVRPLLENADISVLNLETPLAENPYYDPTKPRPATFHPYKSYSFAADVSAAQALKTAGVDLVDIGNNHLYDMLDAGVVSTVEALDAVDLWHFGAGLTESEAWQPVVMTEAGQTIAFIGCSAIGDINSEINLVASDKLQKGGAAYCEEEDIRQIVADAKAQYDNVIMMIHGGKEYQRHPSDTIKRLTAAAREAGATLVINHTPHIVGGFDWDGKSFVAWTLGNFIFDQNFWATFQTYLLSVHIRKGEVIRAYVEPLMIEGYITKGVTGGFADYMAREAAGREAGPFLVENGAMETDFNNAASRQTISLSIDGGDNPGKILSLPHSQWVSGFSGSGFARLGRDLLWTGTFERNTTDITSPGGALWRLTGVDKFIGAEYAHTGKRGVQLRRDAKNKDNVALTLVDRAQLPSLTAVVSVTGWVRTSENAKVDLKVYWYDSRTKSSIDNQVEVLEVSASNTWTAFRVELSAPISAIAVKPLLRLAPAETGKVSADFDDIRLIAWAPPGTSYSPLYDNVWVMGKVDLQISQEVLPGAEEWAVKSLFGEKYE